MPLGRGPVQAISGALQIRKIMFKNNVLNGNFNFARHEIDDSY